MQNIVFLMNHLANKGPVNVVLDICRHLDRSQFNPIIVTLVNESKDISIKDKFESLNIEIRQLHSSYLKIELRTSKIAKQVQGVLSDLDGYVLHAHCYHPTIVASRMKHCKTIATIHNISIDDFTMKHGKIMGTLLSERFRHSLKHVGCSVALSDCMLKYYEGCSDNLQRIYNGVSFKNDYSESQLKEIALKLKIPADKKIVIVSGSLIPRKNPEYVISELNRSKSDNFLCIFLGKGLLLEACKELAGDDARFRFEGMVSNVDEYLAVADLCISASKSEGLPLGVLEALCMGVPTILSDIPPHKEIADSLNREEASVFTPETGRLLEVFEKNIDKGFARDLLKTDARRIYGADVMVSQYEELYKQMGAQNG